MNRYLLILLLAVSRIAVGCKDDDSHACSCPDSVIAFTDTFHTFGPDTIYSGDSVLLEAPAGNWISYLWESNDYLSCTDCPSVWVSPYNGDSSYYYLSATDTSGFIFRDTFRVVVMGYGGLYVPNAFSPNSDGINDLFRALGFNAISFAMQVKDGNDVVFQADSPWEGWDGKINGSTPDCRNFDVVIDVTFGGGTTKHFENVVTLTQPNKAPCPDNYSDCIFESQFNNGGFDPTQPNMEYGCP